ncbi:MAG TPA: SdrD B-like domain-containing protein, partial [Verrucomicrobiae bacterium]|nr:SdrD B-like domain-containing protein [Verrucomicrobiae bacterium]
MKSLHSILRRQILFPAIAQSLSGLSTLIFLSAVVMDGKAATIVQDFYLPMPESQIYQANSAIISGTGSTIDSTFSILVTGNNTIIYYDQWEDGYETDLSNPTQSTTQIWGDGNDAHGIPPGFAHNPLGLPAGTIITLTNNVALPRNPGTILWDARDHIGATKAIVITRAAWPVNPGPVFAGAVSVLSTLDYGTNYISPVGQNLSANLFKYVGMFIMAAQNNTTVTIDPNGNGVGTTNIVLNQGESYLVNGGIKTGGRVTATKPIQADLIIGHVGASYASDWFTLYPVEEWDDTYYTPVGSAATQSQPAYVYVFNPNTNAITINYNTRSGSGSFSVPATNGVFQFQMPVSSGASFTCTNGQNFFAVCTVAANNSDDTAYNWGFTLVPKEALTPQADVGWGPGSADGTVDGSPVWVTTVANTVLYVDYKGDTNGPLIDPNGNHYDTNFTVAALQSQKIYDPSKNQTGMHVYTVDGTPLTAAWGEDPDVAATGNPYIDAGTTVLPFPVPEMIKTATIVSDVKPTGLSIGDTIQYTVEVDNKGLLPLGNTLVIDTASTNIAYVPNSTTWNGNAIPDNPTNATHFPLDSPGYTIPVILSRGTSIFQYLYTVTGSGIVSNDVNIGGTDIFGEANLTPPPTNGATVTLNFSDGSGTPTSLYTAGANVFVTMTNAAGNTSSNTVQTITITVKDATSGDVENILLTETGTNTGVFRNITALPTSTTSGLGQQDGTLHVSPGDTLSVSYTDPTFFDSASSTAAIQIPALTKQLYLSINKTTNGAQLLDRVDPVANSNGPTRNSVDIGSSIGSGLVVFDRASSNNTTGTTNWTHITTNAANRLMLVGVSYIGGSGNASTGIKYNGASLTKVLSITNVSAVSEIWQLVSPSSGTNSVIITHVGTGRLYAGAVTFSGVATNTPLSATNKSTGTASPATVTITSAPTEIVFDNLASDNLKPTLGTGPTQRWDLSNGSAEGGAACTQTGASSVSISWTAGNPWSQIAVSVKAAAGGGSGPSTNATTFTQTQPFCSSFVLASNNFVTITNYITVTNGSLPANPAVTATLQYGGVNFLTLTNPTYSSTSNYLAWSFLLTSNITIPSAQTISCLISNGQPGTAFHVNYDSTNAPSKITLPTFTVINVNTLNVYDAPYPNGNLVSTPVAGSTVYVRANVSDPFGSYDITSLGLAITAPNPSANVTTNLGAANVVTNDGCSKTYEFAWTTGPTTGGYIIAATANEGTEGITATTATSISLIYLDLGTPSTTEFTSGYNGPPTNGYAATNSSVCVQVQDLDQNTDPTTLQVVNVTISSSFGDLENLTLQETGTNTGIFAGCINSSTNTSTPLGGGTLVAPVGSVLTASYTDPTDSSDHTTATAIVLPPPGVQGVLMTKTLVSPSSGPAVVGNPVVFNLQAVNTGSTTLTNVILTDNFPSGQLGYSSASVTPSTIASGTLTWTNIGALTPGQGTNITVTFTTLASGNATNSATANGGTAVNTSSATVLITHPALTISKLLLSPASLPVPIGSNVVFRILVQNSGDTAIPTLPLEDNFSGAYFQFVSATIPPDGSGFGSLIWTNLAGTNALAPNAIITNDVTMTVVGQGNPANNTAVADYAVDTFSNAIPTSTGSTNIVTAAATISGYVYNDKDQSGTLTAGDTPLSDVTVEIYTDPTGTGTPGTLVQMTTTDGSGYYELDNLPLGHFVVVATDLPGFANTVPANGRLAFNITSLTTSANNYFFQYQPSPLLYSTFSGTVYNDILGTGSNTSQAGLANVTVELVQDVNSNGIADPGEPALSATTTDTGGNYSFTGVTPGSYVIRETDLFGYYSTGDSQPPNDNQIGLVASNGVSRGTNNFFERLLPTAVNDTNSAFYLVPGTIYPLTNDISPNGDPLTISSAVTTNGIIVINPGSTNLTFTPTNTGVAYITYIETDAHGGTSSAVITVNITALADLAIGKSAAASTLATSNLVYTISVTNFGPSAASSVVITDALPAGGTFVSADSGGVNNGGIVNWALGTLANGEVTNLTLTIAAPASGTLINTASVSSPISDPNSTNDITPPVTTTVTPVADLAVGKSATASVLATSNLTYTISVTNFGPSSASSVVVTDALPAGVTFVSASGNGVNNSGVVNWSLGTLANGAVSNVTVTVTAPTSGTLSNTASVTSPTSDPNSTNNVTPSVTTTVTPVADIGLGKTGPASVLATSNLTYTISVTNFGPSAASNVVVTDTLPAGVTFVSASGNGVNNSGTMNWSLGTLANGAVSNLTVTVTAPTSGTLNNTASVSSPTSDPNTTNNVTPPVSTTVIPVADLGLGKSAAASVLATSNLTYTISVTNFGPSSASSVVVTDTLPAGVTFVSASGNGVNNSGTVNWSLGTLANGAVSNVTVTVTAPTSGTLNNSASVTSPTSDPNSTNNVTPPVSTTVTPVADVGLGKTGPSSVLATSNLTYTISVTNFGPSAASGVVVTDALPAGVTFVSASGNGVNNSGVVNWSLGTLANGAVSNVTVTVAAPASGTLSNSASVA